jgi:hypothetical protein
VWCADDSLEAEVTFSQEERVWQLQCWLHAMKPCSMCGVVQVADVFGGYGCQPCEECDAHLARSRRARWK